jgi:hypothetical protein
MEVIEDYALHGTWSTSLQGAKTSVELTELTLSTEPTENPEPLELSKHSDPSEPT